MKIITKDGENFSGVETINNTYYLRETKPISDAKIYTDIIKNFEKSFNVSLVDTHIDEEEGKEWYSVDEMKEFYNEKCNLYNGNVLYAEFITFCSR